MARIAEDNPRYRTKERMCADLSVVLSDVRLSEGTKLSILNEILWTWTEFHGKFNGCPYWSVEAKKSYKESKKKAKLVHDAIVPRAYLRNRIMKMRKPGAPDLHKFLEEFCIGVVITKKEEEMLNALGLKTTMPEGWDGNNPWTRHQAAGIKVSE